MTQANLIGILILFNTKSHKIEEAETKTVGLALTWRSCGRALSHNSFGEGHSVGHEAQLPLTVSSGMRRSGVVGLSIRPSEPVAVASSHWDSLRFVTQYY